MHQQWDFWTSYLCFMYSLLSVGRKLDNEDIDELIILVQPFFTNLPHDVYYTFLKYTAVSERNV